MTFLRLRPATPAAATRAPGAPELAPGPGLTASRGPGGPLPGAARPFLEPRLGFDFGRVRVHGVPRVQRQEDPEEAGEEPEAEAESEPASRPSRGVARARTEAAAALDRAVTEVRGAITAFEAGEALPEAVATALGRFFPRETGEFLPLLLRHIELVRGIIEGVRVRRVSRPLDVATEPLAVEVNFILEQGWPARAFPPHFIALFPPFYRAPRLQPTRLLHEAFHWYFPTFVLHRRNTRGDAFAYQGFVSLLGGLEQGVPLRRYRAPAAAGGGEGREGD
ncbi:MAG TPA: hypothetical protein VLF66_09440 [Thermoanaerobaculia bacterium]|nr:hypothetical protein [Thermoanaerobaculia bacterium]